MWEIYLKILTQHLPTGHDKSYGKSLSEQQVSGQEFTLGPSKYKAEVLATHYAIWYQVHTELQNK